MSRATVEVEGFVAGEPERRVTRSGDTVLGFSVAHTPRRRDRLTGEWEDAGRTSWFQVALWGDDVARFEPILHKGTPVVVKGEPEVRAFDGKEGPGASIDIRFARVSTLPPRQRQGAGQPPAEQWAPPPEGEAWSTPGLSYGDEEPF